MAKKRPNTTTSTQPGKAYDGYRPFEKGYQPVTAQTSQGEPSAQKPPKPPTGGTGQTPPPQSNSAKGA